MDVNKLRDSAQLSFCVSLKVLNEQRVEATVFTRPMEPQGLPAMAYGKHRRSLNNKID